MINKSLIRTQHKWSSKFISSKNKRLTQRNEERHQLEIERKLYHPRVVDRSWMKLNSDVMREIQTVEHNENGASQRSNSCLYCNQSLIRDLFDKGGQDFNYTEQGNKLSIHCALCPQVIHKKCLEALASNQNLDNIIQEKNPLFFGKEGILLRKHITRCTEKGKWRCPSCHYEVEQSAIFEKKHVTDFINKREQFFASLKLQANILMHKEQIRYKISIKGILRLQAVVREVTSLVA